MRYYGVFLEFFEYFSEVDRNEFVYHYLYFAEVTYRNHFCLGRNDLVEETPSDAEKNVNRLVPSKYGGQLFKLDKENPEKVDDTEILYIYDTFKDDIAGISENLQEIGQKTVAQ